MQDYYIGSMLASQAEEAGPTPVSCFQFISKSKWRSVLGRLRFFVVKSCTSNDHFVIIEGSDKSTKSCIINIAFDILPIEIVEVCYVTKRSRYGKF